MGLNKTISVEEFQIVSRFEALRKILLAENYSEHLLKPLAYWALPNDRRLPLAFLGRKLEDLLNVPFVELSATPGIGRKKMAAFVQLLARAANTDPLELPSAIIELPANAAEHSPHEMLAGDEDFNPANISEVTWAQWRANVVRHGLTAKPLGRLAPSLHNMTRMIWRKPLGDYVNNTLAEIRDMRTHGEKRVRAMLSVFYAVHTISAGMGIQKNLTVRIVPRLIDRVEQWIGNALQSPDMPSQDEIFSNYVEPLLEQIRIDAARQIVDLAESRLGIGGPITSVRQAARNMGLTRARVYQLLNEINDIMAVRWPTGRHQSHELREKLQTEAATLPQPPDLRQFLAAVELFYPGNRRGADGAIEHIAEPAEQQEELLVVS